MSQNVMCQLALSPTDRLERRQLSLGVRLSGLNVNYPCKLSSWRVKGMTVVAQRLCTAGRRRMERTPTTVWHRLFLRLILEVIFREPPTPSYPTLLSSPSLPPSQSLHGPPPWRKHQHPPSTWLPTSAFRAIYTTTAADLHPVKTKTYTYAGPGRSPTYRTSNRPN